MSYFAVSASGRRAWRYLGGEGKQNLLTDFKNCAWEKRGRQKPPADACPARRICVQKRFGTGFAAKKEKIR
ncbi:MAG: hypothetical protein LBJ82_01440, partial [Deltaproteobacteria bacterium]|nr:hypothetical protein [Deltaproteobacteria bacterium]